ncbi:MAG TPA: hypothetical protein VHR45_24890 [Thermoanaerobaculia bacterium]|nr:hypothetical protein [Thermoanaerobaculia bacterium]
MSSEGPGRRAGTLAAAGFALFLTRGLAAGAVLALGALPAAPPAGNAGPASAYSPSPGPGPYAVEAVEVNWIDADRRREVPAKIYYPKRSGGPFPAIVFSHGLGGSRNDFEYLGRYWASHGYVSVHVQHAGTDSRVLSAPNPRETLLKAVKDPQLAIARLLDVTYAFDHLEALQSEPGPLKGRINLKALAVAGHSFGAWTALSTAGLASLGKNGEEPSLPDPRVRAVLLLSPPVPASKDRLALRYEGIHVPCFHMTGTLDDSPLGDVKAAERRIAFDHIASADQFLVTFSGGDHMAFSGRKPGSFGGENDALLQDYVKTSSTAFWDAYLRGETAAKAWLAGGALAAALGKDAKVEIRLH